MKVIVGLGNPGSKYKETKHNIGFITLDEIAYRQNVSFNNSNFEADIAEFFIGTEKVLLVKPLTFMNESGRSVGPLLTYFGVDEEDLIVIYDDYPPCTKYFSQRNTRRDVTCCKKSSRCRFICMRRTYVC